MRKAWLLGAALALPLGPAAAQDAYVVGLSGAMTGPASATYAPVVEAIRLYVDGVNAKGGVNGKQVRLVVQDDGAEPSKAAANAKRFLTQDNAVVILNASLSSTYAPMLQEAKRAGVATFFAGSVCPPEVYPKAQELQFCSTSFGARYDSRLALGFMKEQAKEPIKLGLAAMAIPISRGEIDFAEEQSKTLGMTPVDKEVIPPPTADYTPFATKLKEAGANWVYSWAPWVTQVKTLEALRRLGWDGNYVAYAHINAEDELARLKDEKLYVFGANAFFSDNAEGHKEIRAAAQKAGATAPVTQLAEGWIAAAALEAALKKAGWPANAEKVAQAMAALEVDTKGLRGGKLVWTAENHFRTQQSYRIYRWSNQKNGIELVKDWTTLEVK
jgi:branched-chain amino acid transport system substrate-binding protein